MFKLKLLILMSVLLFINNSYALEPYVEKELLNKIIKKYKVFSKKRFYYLQETLEDVEGTSDLEKLEAVNEFYNGVRYSPDIKIVVHQV